MLPPILYHYFDAGTAWECLKEGSLAFTPPIRFNDPFDYNPALNFELTQEELQGLSKDAPEGVEVTQQRIEAGMLQNRRDFQENLFGVFCLTTKANDPLMWGHYGDRHRGVMIGFDRCHSDFSLVEEVIYSPKRPCAGVGGAGVGKTLRTKSDVWKEEDEWRLTAELSKCEIKMVDGKPVYIQRPERECFSSITFGCRTEPAFMVAVVNSLGRWGLGHCAALHVRMCDTTYDLIPKEFK